MPEQVSRRGSIFQAGIVPAVSGLPGSVENQYGDAPVNGETPGRWGSVSNGAQCTSSFTVAFPPEILRHRPNANSI